MKIKMNVFGALAIALTLGAASFGGAKSTVRVDASAAEGKAYGYANLQYNSIIEEKFAPNWTWQTNTVFKQDSISQLEWKVSSGRRSSANDKFYIGRTDSAEDAAANGLLTLQNDDIDYAGIVTAVGQSSGYGFTLMSMDYIEAINDLHFSFSSEGGHVYVLYHLPTDNEGVWSVIKRYDGENAFPADSTTYVGSHGVWADGKYDSFNWTFKKILVKETEGAPRARIAFVYWTGSYALNLKINYFLINTDQAAIGYMDYLGGKEWCSGTIKQFYVRSTTILAEYLSEAQNTTLQNTAITGTLASLTHYTNYYDFFSYVCQKCGVTMGNPLSTSVLSVLWFGQDKKTWLIVIPVVGVSIILVALFVSIKKKKRV